ncbi:tail fiber domain-containing protein [Psychroserpens ponticola]|uniref:Tail fiber domain-containing protein n=1 Tax=Psychroserpens ponticola TaxID=2932268 RepID=A0ABY7RXS2_9FLAO|nr:tail fiber domain-containing protein [Psychroserpens ponticola]WCO01744.1 tail fiber domain-containing protein [Psychroserpens ponticola]
MKTKLTVLALLISIVTVAQNGINYKAVIKDDLGNVVANSNIDVQISLEIFTLPVYVETHNVDTNANGLIILNIGEGTVVEGAFESIDWKNDKPNLNVQIDIGNGYVDLGSTPFKVVPYAIRAMQNEGLVEIFEGGNRGLRRHNANPDYYGDIGEGAVDLSFSDSDFAPFGAIGDYSFAMGIYASALGTNSLAIGLTADASGRGSIALGSYSEASGNDSFAIGRSAEAISDYAIALGNETVASGEYSTAIGYDSSASENYSTAIGSSVNASGFASMAMGTAITASGDRSTAMGFSTTASGEYSTAMGRSTQAFAYNSTAIGRYNVSGGNATIWNDIDPLFEIGNGTSSTERSNALTVRKNGNHIINSSSTGLTISAESTGIIINNPGQSGVFVSGAENYGASLEGEISGLTTRSSNSENPDLILRGNSSANNSDDAIISSDPTYGSSDFYIRSYDGVIVQLDYDDNESGSFIVRNGDNENSFSVSEGGNIDIYGNVDISGNTDISGNVDIDGTLRIGDEDIEDEGLNQLSFNADLIPAVEGAFSIGSASRRWRYIYATYGNILISDRRNKTNIVSLNYGLKDIMKLNPVSFNFKTDPNGDVKLGLIAQDVLKVIPEIVKTHDWKTDENGNKIKKELERMGVFYSDLIPVLIKAIQEQQKLIDTQKTELNNLSAEIENVKNIDLRVKQLEALLKQ